MLPKPLATLDHEAFEHVCPLPYTQEGVTDRLLRAIIKLERAAEKNPSSAATPAPAAGASTALAEECQTLRAENEKLNYLLSQLTRQYEVLASTSEFVTRRLDDCIREVDSLIIGEAHSMY